MTDTLDLNELERRAKDRELWLYTDIQLNLPDVYALIARAREAERLREELRTSLVIVGNLGQRTFALEADNKRLAEEFEEELRFSGEIIAAVLAHCGIVPSIEDEWTVADLQSVLEDHNSEFDRAWADNKRLAGVASEYDALIRHMDAGGDFFEFMASRSCERLDRAEAKEAGNA